jgi:hypothetical protein
VRWFCLLIGHKWNVGRWFPSFCPGIEWGRHSQCLRCGERKWEHTKTKSRPLDVAQRT